MTIDELTCELNRTLDGLTVLEKALLVASAFREVWGDEWVIEAKPDGNFIIVQRRK